MVINLATIDFAGGASGGGGKPAVLQEKTATVVSNGSQTILPDEGFDGLSSVNINAAITGASSAIDFSIIGYSDELSAELNSVWNNDVAYSKTLYDAWDLSITEATNLYKADTKLVYAPNIDTSNVIGTYGMFDGCTSLTTVPLYDTSNVGNMNFMFRDCRNLTSVPLFDTSKGFSMISMFSSCFSLTSVPAFNTSNVSIMERMFLDCSNLVSVPLFDTSKVTDMGSMFSGCSSLKTVPLFDTSKVTNMTSMFNGCSSLTSVPAFDTSKATTVFRMFKGCTSLTSVPELDTSNASVDSIFDGCSSLTTIEGISYKSFSASTMSAYIIVGYSQNKSIRKAVFKDIGFHTNAKQFNTSYITNWGVNSDEIPDARQSLIDSLITYSYDRVAAGYLTCTITLSTNTKALLTDDEKSQIIAKGYVIA